MIGRLLSALVATGLMFAGGYDALLARPSPSPAHAAAPSTIAAFSPPKPLPATPGSDFYRYVNADWSDSYKLPPDRAEFGGFQEAGDAAEETIHQLLEEAAASAPPGTMARKLGDLYASLMDRATIEKLGLAPLRPHLDRIAAMKTTEDLLRLFATIGYDSPIDFTVNPHPDDPTQTIVWLGQSGLGMPHRSYYLTPGARVDEIRMAYRKHLTTMMSLLGYKDPSAAATQVYNVEVKIARAQSPYDRGEMATGALRLINRVGLKAEAPGLDWDFMLDAAGLKSADRFIVTGGAAVADLAKLVKTIPLDDWKAWMTFHFAEDFSIHLPKAFRDSAFEFQGHAMLGMTQEAPDWRFAINTINSYMGFELGQLYVEHAFPPERRRQVEQMVENIRAAFRRRIETLDWMDKETRVEALTKLSKIKALVAYPDTVRDYSGIKIERGKAVENLYRVMQVSFANEIGKLGKPADRGEWPIPPQVANAFYTPFTNSLCLPAAILAPPFFNPDADAATNYGAVGAVIGHEMSHGFDDHGRQFDGEGIRRNWWSDSTNRRFLETTRSLVGQYNAFCPRAGVCVNGYGSLGENIGDLSGLQIAYEAYRATLNGAEAPVIDGLTGDQRFFLSFARTFRAKLRGEMMDMQIRSDHPPNNYRVNGAVRNMDAWYDAFDIKPGDRLYLAPEDRVHVW